MHMKTHVRRVAAFAAIAMAQFVPSSLIFADDPTLGKSGADMCALTKQRVWTEPGLATNGPEGAADPNLQTDLLHNDLQLDIDPDQETIAGSNQMTVRSLIDGLTTFQVRLREQFDISTVLVNNTPAVWSRLSVSTIEITLPTTMSLGEEFAVFVAYSGETVSLGFGSINFASQDGTPVVFTLSEPWYAYTWWPNKDDNRDKATADIRITAPSWMTVASNGLRQSETDLGDGRVETHWATLYPMTTYLHSFAATNYTRFESTYTHDNGAMPLEFFIYPQSDTPENRDRWLIVDPMLDVFGDLFGPYPFIDEKYGIYQFNFGGGMEHQTMTGQGGFGESLTAHELAHQWWGDMITCATWNDIWLNEGFATYSEALWQEFKTGGTTEDLHNAMADRRPFFFDGSTYTFDATSASRIFSTSFSYRKGAWILHMLRRVVGDDNFFDALLAFRAAHEFDSAITDEFRMAVEGVVGDDLAWFFDQWVYGVGAPWYEHAWTPRSVNGAHFIEVMIAQQQPANYDLFSMPIELDVETALGGESHAIWNDALLEHHLIPVAAAPTGMTFDPETWILAESSQSASFQDGPPKIVQLQPPSGSAIGASDSIQATFHIDVAISPADVELEGPDGPVAINVIYDIPSQTVTITPSQPIATTGDYQLTIRDSVMHATAMIPLDGEYEFAANNPAAISGDGEPGGDFVATFTVETQAGFADFNSDGVTDGADLAALLAAWGVCKTPGNCAGDITGDGVVDGADLASLLASWGPTG